MTLKTIGSSATVERGERALILRVIYILLSSCLPHTLTRPPPHIILFFFLFLLSFSHTNTHLSRLIESFRLFNPFTQPHTLPPSSPTLIPLPRPEILHRLVSTSMAFSSTRRDKYLKKFFPHSRLSTLSLWRIERKKDKLHGCLPLILTDVK